ncbi:MULTISPECIES: TetR family transcriptional regulator [Streptomyces]|uniref:TetR/AcrR family transcriptional regulator n=1 Tax=Streptomyces lycopersici TaxID=2974589 RepID=UPI0021D34826|nr:TetR family transcriptional regulator [Streptomyces sp. NEAU-383]
MAERLETREPPARRGRRPGRNTTRQAVLDAARRQFAAAGFKGTTIRAIAADAGVDAALVMQFFRSKDELFGAVMSISPEALSRIAGAFSGPLESVGEQAVRAYLAVWEGDQPDADALRAMLRGAVSNEQAGAQLREFIESRLSEGVQHFGSDPHDAALRAALASSMLIGITVGRQIVRVSVLAEEDREAIVRRVGPALQAVLVPPQSPTR